ncbi:MAG: type IV toxin-antitoxin system AbiEi family antitoxin domain-containing protein [Kiritimatiellae bacterium]|nr:type IV toxin-antitoxin system AbiEi family antitoxin domain-containing protein [Kiritimatiellia bacterium]
MKRLEWYMFLLNQQRQFGKVVFTVTELANVAGVSLQVANVELARLVEAGILARYARGRYGLPEVVSPDDLLPLLDSRAYLTGTYGLHRHNLITQIPRDIACFTSRRHNRSRVRETPVGRFTFICVRPSVYHPPEPGALVSAEQALCDFVYLARRRGLDPQTQVTFRGLDRIRSSVLSEIERRYPATVIGDVRRILRA